MVYIQITPVFKIQQMLLFPGKIFYKTCLIQSAPNIKMKWHKCEFLKINFTKAQLH